MGAFNALDAGPKTLAHLANESSADMDALRRLLDACVGLELLSRQGEHYLNTPAATTYLCKVSPDRLTDYISYSNKSLWRLWGNLEDAIREGTNRWEQTFGWNQNEIFANFFKTEESKTGIRAFNARIRTRKLAGCCGCVRSEHVSAAG